MKIVDLDALFEEYVRDYVKKNKGLTPDALEDKVPELYAGFGSMPLAEFDGKSAEEYYASLSGSELCALLAAHVDEEVPVSDFLIDALREGDTEDGLYVFTEKGTDEELASYAINILRDKACNRPLLRYLDHVTSPDTDDGMRELMGEIIIENAAEIADDLIARADVNAGQDIVLEALSNCPKSEEIFDILARKFKATSKLSAFAHLFVRYGDERAIGLMKERLAGNVRYADYTELRYAIEALGGEYEDDRDFSSDSTYRKIKGK